MVAAGAAAGKARQRYGGLGAVLRKTGAKSARRNLRTIPGRERRFGADTNRVISERIVCAAQGTKRGIALKDPTGRIGASSAVSAGSFTPTTVRAGQRSSAARAVTPGTPSECSGEHRCPGSRQRAWCGRPPIPGERLSRRPGTSMTPLMPSCSRRERGMVERGSGGRPGRLQKPAHASLFSAAGSRSSAHLLRNDWR